MNAIRRGLTVIGLLPLVVVGSSIPASATFQDSVTATTGITTMNVLAPTNVVGKLTCAATSTMSATWTKSTTARVTSYVVSVYFSDGFIQTVQVPSTATSWSATIDQYYVTAYSIQYAVTAQTDYGWIKESAKTGSFKC